MQASQDYVGTDVPATATVSGGHRHLLFHAAWGLGAIVFVSIGWLAMRPWDPRGAISLLTHVNPSMMMLEVLALAVATSAVATVLAGQDHPDVGGFAVGIGVVAFAVDLDELHEGFQITDHLWVVVLFRAE